MPSVSSLKETSVQIIPRAADQLRPLVEDEAASGCQASDAFKQRSLTEVTLLPKLLDVSIRLNVKKQKNKANELLKWNIETNERRYSNILSGLFFPAGGGLN